METEEDSVKDQLRNSGAAFSVKVVVFFRILIPIDHMVTTIWSVFSISDLLKLQHHFMM
jgi:hypothetical protein